jgi:hypothetical protein
MDAGRGLRVSEGLQTLPASLGFGHLSDGLVRSHLLASAVVSVEVGQTVWLVDDGIGPWLATVESIDGDGTIWLRLREDEK